MLTIIVPVIPVMTTVAYDHHPPTVIGAKDPGVPAVMIPVIKAHNPGVSAVMIFPIVIPILTTKRKGRTG
jgi:hypothetical protein